MYVHKLAEEYAELIAMLEDPEIDPEVVKDTLDGVKGEVEDRIQAYALVRTELLGSVASLKAEIDRMTKLKRGIESNIERLDEAIDTGMKTIGKNDLKTDLYRFHYKKNPPHLVIKDDLDMGSVPAQFLKFLPPEIDKQGVKAAIKAGETFDWAWNEQDTVLKID